MKKYIAENGEQHNIVVMAKIALYQKSESPPSTTIHWAKYRTKFYVCVQIDASLQEPTINNFSNNMIKDFSYIFQNFHSIYIDFNSILCKTYDKTINQAKL